MLYELIYTSIASREMNNEDLNNILTVSRDKNKRLGITGILLYQNRTFIQLLEGEKEEVCDLYKTIQEDDRHMRVTTFWESEIELRNFAQWSMAFAKLIDIKDFDPEVVSMFLDKGFTNELLSNNPNVGQQLLLSLRSCL